MAVNKKDAAAGLASAVALITGAQIAGAADADFSAPADDWTGLYAGVGVGAMGGDTPIDNGDDEDYQISNDVIFGGFVGYNAQMDSVVIGAELALQSGADADDDNLTDEDYTINYIADAKFKLGVDVGGNALIYGFGGISGGQTTSGGSGYDYGFFGVNYGIGAEMMVTEQFSIGAELMGRTIIDPYGNDDTRGNISHHQGMLRAAFHF